MNERDVIQGMAVATLDGTKVGKVVRADEAGFIVEKGLLFRKDYLCRFEDVADVREGQVVLSRDLATLKESSRPFWEALPEAEASTARPAAPASPVRSAGAAPTGARADELRMPVVEEELVAQTSEREAGEVHVHKSVVTEVKQIEVPVTREEVHVERVAVDARPAAPGEALFEETDETIPIHEEVIEVHKRPVVREEVRINKTAEQEMRAASAETRREEVRIDKTGSVGEVDLPGGRTRR
ncbi:MAG TPA: YsnF/AvaK domain-containing protein [Polyangia bacterium]|nr:YsnF/AvaK domain-containing protein [Polyangia bacterium]